MRLTCKLKFNCHFIHHQPLRNYVRQHWACVKLSLLAKQCNKMLVKLSVLITGFLQNLANVSDELHPAADNWTHFPKCLRCCSSLGTLGLKKFTSVPDFYMTVLTQLLAVSQETNYCWAPPCKVEKQSRQALNVVRIQVLRLSGYATCTNTSTVSLNIKIVS